ncbi:MAG: hypothetical protein KDA66_13160 [Planctomycetaceae bacterium]|nr:hypothetical protein [Planctomycetaceae bacterium]
MQDADFRRTEKDDWQRELDERMALQRRKRLQLLYGLIWAVFAWSAIAVAWSTYGQTGLTFSVFFFVLAGQAYNLLRGGGNC